MGTISNKYNNRHYRHCGIPDCHPDSGGYPFVCQS